MNVIAVSLLFAVCAFPDTILSSNNEKCNVVEQDNAINWENLKEDWYETMNTDQNIDKIGGCFRIHEIKSIKNGGLVNIIDYHIDSKSYKKFPLNFVFNNNRQYELKNPDVVGMWKSDLRTALTDQGSTMAVIADEIAETIPNVPYSILTDYENYIIFTRCSDPNIEGDQKGFWIYTRAQHPTAEDVLRIINVISQMTNGWNVVPLALSKCVYAKGLENFIEV